MREGDTVVGTDLLPVGLQNARHLKNVMCNCEATVIGARRETQSYGGLSRLDVERPSGSRRRLRRNNVPVLRPITCAVDIPSPVPQSVSRSFLNLLTEYEFCQ